MFDDAQASPHFDDFDLVAQSSPNTAQDFRRAPPDLAWTVEIPRHRGRRLAGGSLDGGKGDHVAGSREGNDVGATRLDLPGAQFGDEVIFVFGAAQTATQLLHEDHGRFGRPEHDHPIDARDVDALI